MDSSLKFDDHIKMIYKKASRKLTAISKMSYFKSQEKRQISIRKFFESHFNYCPTYMDVLQKNSKS